MVLVREGLGRVCEFRRYEVRGFPSPLFSTLLRLLWQQPSFPFLLRFFSLTALPLLFFVKKEDATLPAGTAARVAELQVHQSNLKQVPPPLPAPADVVEKSKTRKRKGNRQRNLELSPPSKKTKRMLGESKLEEDPTRNHGRLVFSSK